MKIEEIDIKKIKPYEHNPRSISDEAIEKVANSIREFGFQQPIVVDKNMVIIVGHTRVLAAKKLGLKTVPTKIVTDLPDEKVKAYRLADNKTGELTEWDFDLLFKELEELENMDLFGFESEPDEPIGLDEEKYTTKVDVPQYQIKGIEPHIEDLYDTEKTDQLIHEINESNISDDIKEFLKYAAYRHVKFNYSRIAEFYAHQDSEIQDLMEKSALVIIDFDDALKWGYVQMSETIKNFVGFDDDE